MEASQPRKLDTVKISTPARTPAPQKPIQGVLLLEETPTAKREGFSWDESKGIE
jgi:hypothetical protein